MNSPGRLHGPLSRAPSHFSAPVSSGSSVARLSSGGRLEVVGESHYRSALASLTGGEAVSGLRVRAVLLPEPGNPHDPYAVRVEINNHHVGYLPRDDARRYQPALLPITAAGQMPLCLGRIFGGGPNRNYGVWLSLGDPDSLLLAGDSTSFSLFVAFAGYALSATEGTAGLEAVLAAQSRGRRAVAVLDLRPMPRGKYRGNAVLQATVDGHSIGHMTPASSGKFANVVRSVYREGSVPACEVFAGDGRVTALIDAQEAPW